MDADFLLTIGGMNSPIKINSENISVESRDNVFLIRQFHENVSKKDIESLAINFVECVVLSGIELDCLNVTFEAAYYYDVEKHASFSVMLSLRFIEYLADKKLSLNIVGYPCAE